jgi:aromatic ring-cleaving dioxygenase
MSDDNNPATEDPLVQVAAINGYHLHIYYEPGPSRDQAVRLREGVAQTFPDAKIGRMHDVPVGPHPQPMFQVAISPKTMAALLPWLMLNRDGLTVLLHPETGDAYVDHTDHAAWLGSVLPLKVEVLRAAP